MDECKPAPRYCVSLVGMTSDCQRSKWYSQLNIVQRGIALLLLLLLSLGFASVNTASKLESNQNSKKFKTWTSASEVRVKHLPSAFFISGMTRSGINVLRLMREVSRAQLITSRVPAACNFVLK